MGLKLLQFRTDLEHQYFGESGGYDHVARATVATVGITLVVAARAAFTALRVRYPRGVLVGGSLLLISAIAMILLGLAEQKGFATESAVGAIFGAADWIVAIVALFATGYLLWTGISQNSLTLRYAVGALVLAVAFGAASLPAPDLISISTSCLVPLSIMLLAPWALSRVRHA
jgi:hypothetical protein